MIFYKTAEEIELIKQSADVLGQVHGMISREIKPGIQTIKLDQLAEEFIRDAGGIPSFKGYSGFPYSLCISVNENVVHGFPGEYEIQDGDVVSVDCGVLLKEFHSDSAYTYPVGDVDEETMKLLRITKESLYLGIEQVVLGKRIGDISHAVQHHVEQFGYGVVRELVGHGLGRNLHESPEVPNYGKRGRGPKMKEGLVIAIEPMINLGTKKIVQESDGWTIRTFDQAPSAHYEHTVGIINGKTEVLTTFKYIKEEVL